MQRQSPSGLNAVPFLQWGSHLSQFYETGDDLRDTLVPYFKAGLENNESCLWVTGAPFAANQARSALRAVVSDFDERERRQQIEIRDAHEWYGAGEALRPNNIVTGLLQREQDALKQGYRGLRTSGNCAWVERGQWADFQTYESLVQDAVHAPSIRRRCSTTAAKSWVASICWWTLPTVKPRRNATQHSRAKCIIASIILSRRCRRSWD
jgi:hypothetical protein